MDNDSALLERNMDRFDQALSRLDSARDFAKINYQTQLLDLASRLMRLPGGLDRLFEFAPRFQDAGVFYGTDWHYPERLQPDLVRGALTGPARTAALECLSELRMLAISQGQSEYSELSAEQARGFLERVLALNINLVLPDHSEAGRDVVDGQREAVRHHLDFLLNHLGNAGVVATLVEESEKILKQRPIDVAPVWHMLERIEPRLSDIEDETLARRARKMVSAWRGPTALAQHHHQDTAAYTEAVEALPREERQPELERLGTSLAASGLACRAHGGLLEQFADAPLDELATLLGLDNVGRDSLDAYESLCRRLVREAISAETAQSAYGLHCLLNRGILFFPPIAPALWRLTRFVPNDQISDMLHRESGASEHRSGHSLLLAGVISVLGQPLGIGQGNNPTCQSARAISLWSQCDPGYLLELIMWAARDGEIDMHFEGALIRSSELSEGLIEDFHTELDMVSLLLVPHLDKIYWEMGRRIMGRGEDGHRWINPEFHGWWVNRGFASCIQYSTGAVIDFEGFMRRFFATYHPLYNGGAELIYPQPAGVVATDSFGHFIGWHAIAIQRVTLDPDGEMRVYFFNPNNESRQDWGQGVVTSTEGHGEIPGESSLPFDQFVSRLYVYHYNEREIGDVQSVSEESVAAIIQMARNSWAAEKDWHDVVQA
ncbi:hypothetical protein J2T60_000720 [Natronospira proteinivora]|uniref:Uncharacterized protein n=1 Tax=Natronospira proteinivora TaxID=1807133 RepID=A0ABT1G626_9GAMM|nr:hypothetical protein [Natronospira proteinivora]MCP1726755.1 hypothetical protein [Natronospira proteinivora]